MKMKNYINKSYKMDRERLKSTWMKSVTLMLLFVFVLTTSVNAQTATTQEGIKISGVVRDAATKLPVAAAQISVPNKNVSTVTNENGEFSFSVSSLKDVLHITAFDFNSAEVAISGRTNIVVDLYSNSFSNFYKTIESKTGVVKNSSLANSAKGVADLSQTSAMVVDEILQTSLGADVRAINRSGVAGMGSSLFIRGYKSLNANAQPLFVVDGVVWNSFYDEVSINGGYYSNALDAIDVNDIESITVLKDGTSIYGSKAANGVILIKTKRATSMVTKIGLNIMKGITTQPGNVPMMNGEQYRVYANDMFNTAGVSSTDIASYPFLEYDPTKPIYNTYHNDTDWGKEIYQNGSTDSYMINASGGDEKALYYFSLGYTGGKGVVQSTDMQRITSRFNSDINLANNVKIGLNIGYTRVERKLMDDGIDVYSSPTWVARIKSPFLSPNSFTSSGDKTLDFANTDEFNIGNPVALITSSINNIKKNFFNIGVTPEYRFAPNWTISSQFDFMLKKTVERHYVPMLYTPERYLDNYGISKNRVSSQVMRYNSIYDDTRITYENKFDALHTLKAMYGVRFISSYYETDYIEEHNTGSNNNTTITGDYQFLQVRGLNNETRSLANYVNAEYNYDNRFYLDAAISLDGSSRFGRNTAGGIQLFGHSWGVFPSVNGAWLITSEEFMKDYREAISFMKLRAGYGITGNDGIKDYEALAYFNPTRYMARANGLVLGNLENTKVQWETTGTANVGLDLSLFNNRLDLNADFYFSKTSNLLALKSLPEISGLSMYWDNGGELANQGFEIATNFKALNLKNFKWEIGASVGRYKNEILSLPEGEYTTKVYDGEVLTAVGQSIGTFYGYKTNGVFATEAQAVEADLKVRNSDGSFTAFGAGDMIFDDLNNDQIIDEKDRQIIGNANPEIYGTITNNFAYKRFALNTVFTYSWGNDVYNYFRSKLESGSDFSNQTSAMMNRWTAEGQTTFQPKAVYGDPMGNARFSDRWIEDGSYLRLKTVSLSYELPVKSNFIEGLNIWISANNLFTLTKYLGLDPESSSNNSVYFQGVDAGLTPLTKAYYVGVKFNL